MIGESVGWDGEAERRSWGVERVWRSGAWEQQTCWGEGIASVTDRSELALKFVGVDLAGRRIAIPLSSPRLLGSGACWSVARTWVGGGACDCVKVCCDDSSGCGHPLHDFFPADLIEMFVQ